MFTLRHCSMRPALTLSTHLYDVWMTNHGEQLRFSELCGFFQDGFAADENLFDDVFAARIWLILDVQPGRMKTQGHQRLRLFWNRSSIDGEVISPVGQECLAVGSFSQNFVDMPVLRHTAGRSIVWTTLNRFLPRMLMRTRWICVKI